MTGYFQYCSSWGTIVLSRELTERNKQFQTSIYTPSSRAGRHPWGTIVHSRERNGKERRTEWTIKKKVRTHPVLVLQYNDIQSYEAKEITDNLENLFLRQKWGLKGHLKLRLFYNNWNQPKKAQNTNLCCFCHKIFALHMIIEWNFTYSEIFSHKISRNSI